MNSLLKVFNQCKREISIDYQWEKRKLQPYGCNGFGINPEIRLYDIVLDQYGSLLISNIEYIWNKAERLLVVYKKAGYIK